MIKYSSAFCMLMRIMFVLLYIVCLERNTRSHDRPSAALGSMSLNHDDYGIGLYYSEVGSSRFRDFRVYIYIGRKRRDKTKLNSNL